uniref:Uncharacterized protein n=1 Tax=Phlebotomus papatasi TaxID=29031 RepID=A0A1B0DNH7_PHLPP
MDSIEVQCSIKCHSVGGVPIPLVIHNAGGFTWMQSPLELHPIDYGGQRVSEEVGRHVHIIEEIKEEVRTHDSSGKAEKHIESFKGVAYIADDIIDGSTTRRKKPCWHTLKDVQLNAINDAFMLEAATFGMLKKHFSHLDCYTTILDLFRESVLVGSIGQYADMQTRRQDPTTFTIEQYKK